MDKNRSSETLGFWENNGDLLIITFWSNINEWTMINYIFFSLKNYI